MPHRVRAAVIGTGMMGVAHTEALRRLGIEVVGVAGSSPERARSKAAAAHLAPVYDSTDALLADPSVDVVHVTSPNDVHVDQVRAALAAGKHVVCEKPLGVSSDETADLLALAEASGLVHAVCFNIRYYPHNQNTAGLVRDGAIGQPRLVTGCYHQDWLLLETDWNWRLVASRQGTLRAVADIGSHWLDLVAFITGRRVEAVCADLHTFITERNHPVGAVETFAAATVGDVPRSASTWRATTPPVCCSASRAVGGACARSARCPPAARTAWPGRSMARRPRWRGSPRAPSTSGSATGADPTRCSTRILR